ncbi:plasmid replication protein RepC [Phyllobacterium leguminum]|uniref:Replication initiation protein RepC n=1 Tax=Phyllobacterium leguminum TaxID=314237 RepID=A0A318T223_9HYPH|nr:plasmid replication protein RepC [Phyllobacterium leguminum]PYE87847.1 replication initiation protein RepC [Phyllobacterium leguminum]
MEIDNITTPFGRRSMTLAMLTSQINAHEALEGKAINKWQVCRWLCAGKAAIGISDRSLAVLDALVSFYPETNLSKEHSLVVFPSNAQLTSRAHGMADATLRRHIAALIECGLILRRDSPNGKRYARRGRGGEIGEAFGFSLAPLLARAGEFERIAEQVHAEAQALRHARQQITLHRRDIQKLIEAAAQEGISGHWDVLWKRFRGIVEAIPRRAERAELERIAAELQELRCAITKLLQTHVNQQNISGSESQNERQQSNSNTETYIESESGMEKDLKENPVENRQIAKSSYPIELILRACPEIGDYAPHRIDSWRDLATTAAQVKNYLGISAPVYEEAMLNLGPENTAAAIACILQRASHIKSPGGYLRVLARKGRAGEFTVGPMIRAALKANGTAARVIE